MQRGGHGTTLGSMTNSGPPTLATRLTVAALALIALAVGAVWMWTTATGVMVAGMPPWVLGLAVVALLVALAVAVHRIDEPKH